MNPGKRTSWTFMLAAHQRHMAGEPLRPGGPTRVTHPAFGRLAAILSPGLLDYIISNDS